MQKTIAAIFISLCREDLIYLEIEQAVLRMQTVIELGRVARDRKTLPLKVCLSRFSI